MGFFTIEKEEDHVINCAEMVQETFTFCFHLSKPDLSLKVSEQRPRRPSY